MALTACQSSPTTLLLAIDGPTSITSLDLSITLASGASIQKTLPLGIDGTHLPGEVVVQLPDVATIVTVHVEALVDGTVRSAEAVVTSKPHRQLRVVLSLGAELADLGAADLRRADEGDLATAADDLSALDQNFALDADTADLGAPDLAAPDLAVPVVPTLSIVVGRHGGGGRHDDVGMDARFENINALVQVGMTLYVAEYWSGRLRAIDLSTGETSTHELRSAVTNDVTYLDTPNGIAYDGIGSLYVVSQGAHTVDRIELATDKLYRVAGEPQTTGSADGDATTARFDHPQGLAFDGDGNLWIADQGNARLRKITFSPQVAVTTPSIVTASGGLDMGAPTTFNFLRCVKYIDGQLYVGDEGGLFRIDISTSPALATLIIPRNKLLDVGDVAISGDSIYMTDFSLNALWRFPLATPASGTLVAGDNTFNAVSIDATGLAVRFEHPRWLAADALGHLFISEPYTIRRITLATGETTTVVGRGNYPGATGTPPRLDYPTNVWFDGTDTFYISDLNGSKIRKWVRSTNTLTIFAGTGAWGHDDGMAGNATFYYPRGLVGDGAGNLYVCDALNATIRKIDAGGNVTTIAGHATVPGDAPATDDVNGADVYFRYPNDIVFDGEQSLFVADWANGVVYRISLADTTYKTSILVGNHQSRSHKDGIGRAAELDGPRGLAWDGPRKKLYVTDSNDDTVRVVDVTNPAMPHLTTVSGIPYSPFYIDVPAGDGGALGGTRHRSPMGVAIDPTGTQLFVANADGHTVQRLDLSAQTSSTVVGAQMAGFTRPGALPARVNEPHGVAWTPEGLYVLSARENTLLLATGVTP